jgi:hypothetical protein
MDSRPELRIEQVGGIERSFQKVTHWDIPLVLTQEKRVDLPTAILYLPVVGQDLICCGGTSS